MTDRACKTDSARLLEQADADDRDWGAIGIGFGSALLLVGLYVAGVWSVWVIVEALI